MIVVGAPTVNWVNSDKNEFLKECTEIHNDEKICKWKWKFGDDK